MKQIVFLFFIFLTSGVAHADSTNIQWSRIDTEQLDEQYTNYKNAPNEIYLMVRLYNIVLTDLRDNEGKNIGPKLVELAKHIERFYSAEPTKFILPEEKKFTDEFKAILQSDLKKPIQLSDETVKQRIDLIALQKHYQTQFDLLTSLDGLSFFERTYFRMKGIPQNFPLISLFVQNSETGENLRNFLIGLSEEKINKISLAASDQLKKMISELRERSQKLFINQLQSNEQFKNYKQSELIASLIKFYFDHASDRMVIDTLINVAQSGSFNMKESAFAAFINGSGPILQKLMQIIGRRLHLDSDMKKIILSLEENGAPLAQEQMEPLLKQAFEKNKFTQFDFSHPKVGTMAQMYRGTIMVNNTPVPVATRVLKPNSKAHAEEESLLAKKIFMDLDRSELANSLRMPNFSTLAEMLDWMIQEEMKIEKTAQRQTQAKLSLSQLPATTILADSAVDGSTQKIEIVLDVPEIYYSDETTIVMKWVDGVSIDDLKISQELKTTLIEQVITKLFMSSLFQGGVIHGDLHAGNIRFQQRGNTITANLIDYGLGASISTEQQNTFIRLMTSLYLQNLTHVTAALQEITHNQSQITKTQIQNIVEKYFLQMRKQSSKDTLQLVFSDLLDRGWIPKYEFLMLVRSYLSATTLMQAMGSSKKITDMITLELRNDPRLSLRILSKASDEKTVEMIKQITQARIENIWERVTTFSLPFRSKPKTIKCSAAYP